MTSRLCKTMPLIGPVTIVEKRGSITMLVFGEHMPEQGAKTEATPLITRAFEQLSEYLKGELAEFSLPLSPAGTDFQKRVWTSLLTIPYGETASYADIAAMTGNPKACRAVGGANHANPISIVIPCHRVIGKSGSLTGYGGGIAVKRALLELEQAHAGRYTGMRKG